MTKQPGTMLLRCSVRRDASRIPVLTPSQRHRSVSSSAGVFVGSDVVIPPHSPRYVYVPRPVQDAPHSQTLRQGTLPKPRIPLLRTKKQLPWHLENTAPAPTAVPLPKNIPLRDQAHVTWKIKESNLRRQNFLEGYTTLRKRESGVSGKNPAASKRGIPTARQRIMGREKSYEEMSRPSILSFMIQPGKWRHVKRSQAETDAARARYTKMEEEKEYERQLNVHNLYINAKNFIVNTEQLEDSLTKAFDSDFYQYNKEKNYGIWDEEGWPEDTAYLMDRAQNNDAAGAAVSTSGYTEAARRRIMKVTEEMTGGKLVSEASSS